MGCEGAGGDRLEFPDAAHRLGVVNRRIDGVQKAPAKRINWRISANNIVGSPFRLGNILAL